MKAALGRALDRSRYPLSVGAQGLVSGFHFALNLALVRLLVPEQYGLFAFAFVLGMFAQALNNALVATPLAVYTPVIADPAARAREEGMFGSANLLLCLALLAAGLAYHLVGGAAPALASLGVVLFVVAYAARQYSRSVGYARMRPLATATGDLAYVVAGSALVGALAFVAHRAGTAPAIGAVLLALALANVLAMLAERVALLGRAGLRPRLGSLAGYGRIWAQSRWALLGALTTLFLAQAHSLIVTATHGPGAFAPLAAGFVLFGPVRVALLTWQNMVKPELAVAIAEGRAAELRRGLRRSVLGMLGAVLALGLLLLAAWPWIDAFLYAERYAEEPMGGIVALWFLITFAATAYNAPSAALQALTDFRALAVASLVGALVSGALVTLALVVAGPAATLWGVLAAEAVVALWLARILAVRLDARVAAAAGPHGPGSDPSRDTEAGTGAGAPAREAPRSAALAAAAEARP